MGVNDGGSYDDLPAPGDYPRSDLDLAAYDDVEEVSDIWVVQVEVIDEDSDDDTDDVEVATFGPFPPREARSLAHQLGTRLTGVLVEAVPVFPHRTVDEVIGFFLEDDVDDDEDVPLTV